MKKRTVDIVIIGAGLAGLTLARQLLMKKRDLTILHLEKRASVPGKKQKVGESTVQVGGYYFSKTLDMEAYLHCEHLMKYNLRFLWPTQGMANDDIDHYGQGYIRNFSNIASYQIDRNKFEAELIRLNRGHATYDLLEGVKELDINLHGQDENHQVFFKRKGEACQVEARWIIDASGRKRLFARKMKLETTCEEITHGASWFWIDGILNIEKLTAKTHNCSLKNASRAALGHLPLWLSTSSFMGEGFWLWVIPLQGRTSLGVVYDQACISPSELSSASKMKSWLEQTFPLFKGSLGERVIDFSTLRQYSHDCTQTIHRNRWAITGEAGRFNDPLYSPGSDAIAIHNSLIVDAILTNDPVALDKKVRMFESLLKVVYRSFLPSFSRSYAALGDHETFYMKYTWELSVYFTYFVFPFINGLFVEKTFLAPYFRRFSNLGAVNQNLQNYITDFYRWKKAQDLSASQPLFTDFMEVPALAAAEKTFYEFGLKPSEAVAVLERQTELMLEYARYLMAHIDAVVLDDPQVRTHASYIEAVDPRTRIFDPNTMKQQLLLSSESEEPWPWSFCPALLERLFRPVGEFVAVPTQGGT